MLQGGCLCGQVRYEASGTHFHKTFCHCRTCQKAAGAPVIAWVTFPREGFRWTSGAVKHFASSEGVKRGFCANCGTSLTYESERNADEIDITTASLDTPAVAPPDDHIWVRSRQPWMKGDGLPEHATKRE
ncbi:MAG: glutathione-dependent formaldehyde-activating [Rhodospirillales bacterium]|nr:glutathione-dependent formaldehyde-activating [Rhodospirillales bacterium]